MNRRQAKKRLKKTIKEFRECRKKGVSIEIKNHGFVDENGKPCKAGVKGSRFIHYRRPQIKRRKVK